MSCYNPFPPPSRKSFDLSRIRSTSVLIHPSVSIASILISATWFHNALSNSYSLKLSRKGFPRMPQPIETPFLQLSNSLSANSEFPTDLFQRVFLIPANSEAQTQNLRFPRGHMGLRTACGSPDYFPFLRSLSKLK